MNQVWHKYGGSWVDISDYVISIDKIPYINRNRDYSLIVNTINLDISFNYGNTFAVNDYIKVTVGSTIIFTGYIQYRNDVYDNRTHRLTVNNNLNILDTYYISADTLQPVIANTSDPYKYNGILNLSGDIDGYANVQLLWLLQCMFSVAGLTLDTSLLDSVLFTSGYNNTALQYLCLDEGMLWSINQNVATSCLNYDTDRSQNNYNHWTYQNYKPTYLTFINEIFQILGLTLINTDITSYKVIGGENLYTISSISDDNKFSFESNEIIVKNIYGAYGTLLCYTQNGATNPDYAGVQAGDLKTYLRQYYYDTATIHTPLNENFAKFTYGLPITNQRAIIRNMDGGRTMPLNREYSPYSNTTDYRGLNNLLLFWRHTSGANNTGSVDSPDLNRGAMGMLIPCFIPPLVVESNIPGTGDPRYYYYQSTLRHRIRRDYGGYTKTTWKMPIDVTEKSVIQNMIDITPNGYCSELIQEDFGGETIYPNPFE